MFLRKMGRRYLLLHSQRMGDGRVRQRRLGHFEQLAELRQSLSCGRWRADFARKFPRVSVDWERVSGQAEQFPEAPPPRDRHQRIAMLKRNLLTLLREDGPDGIRNFVREVEGQAEEVRTALPARRRRFEASEPSASEYFQALEARAEVLRAEERLQESASVLQEWVAASGSPESRLAYGGVLQQLNRLEEAREQFDCLDRWDFRRHYQLAALASLQGEHDQALCHLLQGLLLNRPVGDALVRLWADKQPVRAGDYWERYGHLWSEWSQAFFLCVYRQTVVRVQLSLLVQRGAHVHEVLPEYTRRWLLKRILEPSVAIFSSGRRHSSTSPERIFP